MGKEAQIFSVLFFSFYQSNNTEFVVTNEMLRKLRSEKIKVYYEENIYFSFTIINDECNGTEI